MTLNEVPHTSYIHPHKNYVQCDFRQEIARDISILCASFYSD